MGQCGPSTPFLPGTSFPCERRNLPFWEIRHSHGTLAASRHDRPPLLGTEGRNQPGIPSPAPAARPTRTPTQPRLILQLLTATHSHSEASISTKACHEQHPHFGADYGPKSNTSGEVFGLSQQTWLGR